jgi:hypothetical protein
MYAPCIETAILVIQVGTKGVQCVHEILYITCLYRFKHYKTFHSFLIIRHFLLFELIKIMAINQLIDISYSFFYILNFFC